MVRSEIISKLSDRIHRKIKKSDLEKVLNIVINAIVEEVKREKSIEIRRFGRFSQKKLRKKQMLEIHVLVKKLKLKKKSL